MRLLVDNALSSSLSSESSSSPTTSSIYSLQDRCFPVSWGEADGSGVFGDPGEVGLCGETASALLAVMGVEEGGRASERLAVFERLRGDVALFGCVAT